MENEKVCLVIDKPRNCVFCPCCQVIITTDTGHSKVKALHCNAMSGYINLLDKSGKVPYDCPLIPCNV